MTKQKVNIQARINRHLRIIKQNVWFESKTFQRWRIWYGLTISMIFIIFIFPIYPSISNIVYTNTEVEFDRWWIDENSIISSHEWIWEWDEAHLVEHTDSYVSVHTILSDDRDLEWVWEIARYSVQIGDSIASIAWKFKVSVNTILWANNLDSVRELKVWENLKIPSVTWYLYKVKFWDSIEKIAKEYWISIDSIEKYNNIKNGYLIAWNEIILPWAAKKQPIIEKPKVSKNITYNKNNSKNTNSKNTKTTTYTKNNTKSRSKNTSTYTSDSWSYDLVWRQPQWRFAWGNCTWYVAQYKNVNWWWNANQWLKNARAKWHATWNAPKVWAIVQFSGGWYNPIYWHVWIVIGIKWWSIIVSDMNYRRINEVTVRKVSINDSAIDWYIYVN